MYHLRLVKTLGCVSILVHLKTTLVFFQWHLPPYMLHSFTTSSYMLALEFMRYHYSTFMTWYFYEDQLWNIIYQTIFLYHWLDIHLYVILRLSFIMLFCGYDLMIHWVLYNSFSLPMYNSRSTLYLINKHALLLLSMGMNDLDMSFLPNSLPQVFDELESSDLLPGFWMTPLSILNIF